LEVIIIRKEIVQTNGESKSDWWEVILNLPCTFILNFLLFLSMVQSIGLDHKVAQVWTSYAAEIDEYLNDGQMMGGKTAS